MPNFISNQHYKILCLTLVMLTLLLCSYDRSQAVANPLKNLDVPITKLVYSVNNFDGKIALMLYDLQSGTHKLIRTDTHPTRFNLSIDGQLALSSGTPNAAQIYILNTQLTNSSPIRITQPLNSDNFPLAWSPDGHYLAFTSSNKDKSPLIFVWDGKTAVDITPTNLQRSAKCCIVSWSVDGRLAFTVSNDIGNTPSVDPSEIYLWNGKTTTNLSQNPSGKDNSPAWSLDGKLAFFSERNGEHDIYIWDGVSIKNGLPDVDSFTNVPPDLTSYYSAPTWTNKGLLAFNSQTSQDTHVQIYVWDGQSVTNLSQNPTLHNGGAEWNVAGRWVFSTFLSSEQLIYVRDVDNKTLLATKGKFPALSSNGYVLFCTQDSTTSSLYLWNGQQIINIVQGQEISAQWQDGSDTACSTYSG